jgi:hypothetical protein
MLVLIPIVCALAIWLRHDRHLALSAAEHSQETPP